MLKMNDKFLTLLCVSLMLGSLFFAAGNVSSFGKNTDKNKKIILVKTEDHRGRERLKTYDLKIKDSYGSHTLVKIESEKIDKLRKAGFSVDELSSRNTISVRGHSFDVFGPGPQIPSRLKIDGYEKGSEGLYIVHMLGPINPDWRNTLERKGVRVLNYVPNYAYAVRMTPKTADSVRSLDFVDWVGLYHPAYKITDDLKKGKISVHLFSETSQRVLKKLKSIDSDLNDLKFSNRGAIPHISTKVQNEGEIEALAKLKDVYYISDHTPNELKMEIDSQIIGGGAWVMDDEDGDTGTAYRLHGDHGAYFNQIGYTGKNVTVAIADTGLGNGTTPDAGHLDFTGRVVGGYCWEEKGWEDGHGHGTHAAGSLAGDSYSGTGTQYAGLDGNYYASQGLAYDSKLYAVKIFNSNGSWVGPDNSFDIVEKAAQNSDAYIHSNSWGEDNGDGGYDSQDVAYDKAVRDSDSSTSGNQPMVITVAAGNGGSSQTIASPGNAKNVITVGATESYVPDADLYGYASFDNPANVADYSSRGWTNDDRVKPDVVAPGSGILSTSSPLASAKYPYSEDNRYEWKSGSSMANPDVAGAAAVVVEWYKKNYGERPSPAMVKSLIINTAHDLNESKGNTAPIPNPKEGWGMVDISKLKYPKNDPVPFVLKDQKYELQTGENRTYKIQPKDKDKPLKITLCWTDQENHSDLGSTLKNNLRLEVTSPSGKVYRGNAFSNGWSQPGQDAISDFDDDGDGWDDNNNVRNVYIPPNKVEQGTYTVEVKGNNVVADCDNDGVLDQDFALTTYNAQGIITSPEYDKAFNKTEVTVEWNKEPGYTHNVSLDGGDWIDVGTNNNYTFTNLSKGRHICEVKATNETKEKLDSVSFIIDKKSPRVNFTYPSEDEHVNEKDLTVEWNGSDSGSGISDYEIRRDGGVWKNMGYEEKYTFKDLNDGNHTVDVKAVDRAGNSENASVNFTLDTDPPALEINSPMYGDILDQDTVDIEWSSSSKDIDHYEVSLDGVLQYEGVKENLTFQDLEEGNHRVNIQAFDLAGNTNNESVNFTVDTVIPNINFEGMEDGQIFGRREVKIEWNASDTTSGINYYEIMIDDGFWEYLGKDTEKIYSDLSEGSHSVQVRAVDGAGNNATASIDFGIDTSSPEVDITNIEEGQLFSDQNISVRWEGNDTVSGIADYKIRINEGVWIDVDKTNYTFKSIPDMQHKVQVKALDGVGHTSTVSVNFTVDTTSPELKIEQPANDSLIGVSELTVKWRGQDAVSGIDHYEVRLKGITWNDVQGKTSYKLTDLKDGELKVYVKAVDKAGNIRVQDSVFKVDNTGPFIKILNPSDGESLVTKSINVTWDGYDESTAIEHYQIRIDGGKWIYVGSKRNHKFEDLPYGKHTIEVKGIDTAGNIKVQKIKVTLKKSEGAIPGYTVPVLVIAGLTLLTIFIGKPWLFGSDKNKKY